MRAPGLKAKPEGVVRAFPEDAALRDPPGPPGARRRHAPPAKKEKERNRGSVVMTTYQSAQLEAGMSVGALDGDAKSKYAPHEFAGTFSGSGYRRGAVAR